MKEKDYSMLADMHKLFYDIAINIVHGRMQAYHNFVKPNLNLDITSSIVKHITDLTEQSAQENHSHNDHIQKIKYPEIAHNNNHKILYTEYKLKKVTVGETELAKHLQKMKTSNAIYKCLSDKLKLSAWEHVCSAIRFARQGNIKNAKLHSKIAGRAIEEFRHFISDEMYIELISEIEEHLDSLRQEL